MSGSVEDHLERQFGSATLWQWTKDWMQSERECAEEEGMTLEKYLWFRAENHDEGDEDGNEAQGQTNAASRDRV